MRLQPHLQSKNICVYTIYVNAKSQLFVSFQENNRFWNPNPLGLGGKNRPR